jgi:P-type Mg2+ transporter
LLEAPLAKPDAGLTGTEAARRLIQYGVNDPAPKKQRSQLVDLLLQFGNPLIAILLFASIVSVFVGELVNASIILVIVTLSVVLNFLQTFRSQAAAARLRATVAPTATVLRDGTFADVPRASVVPGDVIRLSAGDLVPADARLLEATDLHVQESALTGESMPIEKIAKPGDESNETLLLLGTSVVSGAATARVFATGVHTQFGDIATRLRARAPDSEFDHGLKQFGSLITKAVFGLVLFILVVRIGTHRSPFESVLFAVALAVGLTPEFLPMITSVTLARGAVKLAKDQVIVKHLSAIQNLGSIDVLCSDKTGTITRGVMVLESSCDALGRPADAPLFFARLNSKFETGIKSPLDSAIMDTPETADALPFQKLGEIPFDFERRRLSVVLENENQRWLIAKGSPEGLLECASHYASDAGAELPLGDGERAKCRATYEALGSRGFRVLAVAKRAVPKADRYKSEDERGLVLLGFLAFADPPSEGAKEAVAALRADGVRVVIITGDNELVTRHVCAEVGLDAGQMALGCELESLTDAAVAQLAERTVVFARMSPAQKSRVILALKQRSHVVGYLGDGINDAPSLHAADVGISVSSAVDVARDAADIILLEPGLSVLHRGIIEGRRAFGNVTKYLLMGTSSNFGNMFSMAAASVFLPFLPMLPTQLLLNNLLYDLAQVTIPTDNVDSDVLRTPQRWDIRTIRNFMLAIGPISSLYDLLTFVVLLRVFHAGEVLFHTGWFVESLATQTLVLFVIRTPRNPLKSRPSRPLIISAALIVAIGVALPYSPLARVLGFVPLPGTYFLFLIAATLTYLVLVQSAKRLLLRHIAAHRSSTAGHATPSAA